MGSSLIGNKVGEGSLEGTRNMIQATVFLFTTFTALGLIVFHITTWKYTNQEMLIIYPAVSLTLVTTSLCTLLITILTGLGLQEGTTLVNALSFVVLGIPLSCYLTFYVKWIYYGPWLGLAAATLFNCSYFYWLIIRKDLQLVILNSNKRYEGGP